MDPQVEDPENYYATFEAERNSTQYSSLFLLDGRPTPGAHLQCTHITIYFDKP